MREPESDKDELVIGRIQGRDELGVREEIIKVMLNDCTYPEQEGYTMNDKQLKKRIKAAIKKSCLGKMPGALLAVDPD